MNDYLSKAQNVIRLYAHRVKLFSRNARLYLVNVIIFGLAMGIYRLLFNFYVLSLGFDEALLGRLITVSSLTALMAALPMGVIADKIGRKRALLIGGILSGFPVLGMFLWHDEWVFYLMNVIMGVAMSLWMVTMGPFLMENSGDEERTYLFSFGQGLQMLAVFIGNWVGGYMPTWFAAQQGIEPTAPLAYGLSLVVVFILMLSSAMPLFFLKETREQILERQGNSPIRYAIEHPKLLGKLIGPMLVISIGAGLVMPFMNVFYRVVHNQPDPVIGSLFAWASLAMGVGMFLAPVIADRLGKVQTVVLTQGLSIPFLAILGFAPWFGVSAFAYYVRMALMNMSTPVYETFVMEKVDASARGTVASLNSMAWNFGWTISPMISGYIQVAYGFGPAFAGTMTLYFIAVLMVWNFFLRKRPQEVEERTEDEVIVPIGD